MIKRLAILLLVLLLVFGGIFGLKFYQLRQMAGKMGAPPPATVASTTVQSEVWPQYLRAVGTLVANQGVFVTNEVVGQVSRIGFESGAKVKRGQLLLELDSSVDQAELNGLLAEQKLAELQLERMTRLLRDHTVSQADYDEARARVDSNEARLAAKRAVTEKKQIRAPFSGQLGIRLVDLGEYLAPGARIVELQAVDPIHVDFALPERHFSLLATGQTVTIAVQSYPGKVFTGKIAAINPAVDVGSRTLRLRATLSNPDGVLRPGMFAEVRTLLPAQEQVLTLPRTAITYNPYGDAVFVIIEQDQRPTVQQRQVQTGEEREGRVVIVSGLTAGEQVVSAGQVKLRNGMPVQIDNSVQLPSQVKRP